MGSSSYVSVADPQSADGVIHLQFIYGHRRDIRYQPGDAIHWELDDLPASVSVPHEICVPAWTMEHNTRYFALSIKDNCIAAVREIDEAEADRLEANLHIDPYHAWKRN